MRLFPALSYSLKVPVRLFPDSSRSVMALPLEEFRVALPRHKLEGTCRAKKAPDEKKGCG